MESALEFHRSRAMLEWHIELGADEAISETPVNRFELVAKTPVIKAKIAATVTHGTAAPDAVSVARDAAAAANNLGALKAAIQAFKHCDLKKGARSCVFSDGNPASKVMLIGQAPGREEDIQGRPFVGQGGQLLDQMFATIGMARDAEDAANGIYITNVLPWRPPQDRDPLPAETAMMMPFVERHVALANPELIVLLGNATCQAVLGEKGIARLRGKWNTGLDLPVLPMYRPAFLLNNPAAKADAWHDLLMLQSRLRANP